MASSGANIGGAVNAASVSTAEDDAVFAMDTINVSCVVHISIVGTGVLNSTMVSSML